MEFTAKLENFNTKLWTWHIKVPNAIARQFLEMGDKRVVCHLNDAFEFQCAIMAAGDGVYFINLNKKIRTDLNLKDGTKIKVRLEKDESEYGLPFPDEFKEVLAQDKKANGFFKQLTPGKQRNLIYAAGQAKNTDLRILRSIIIADHLKNNAGQINFRTLLKELQTKK